jgi:hypothetical protein
MEYVPENIWEMLTLIGYAEDGDWPELAGMNDQCFSFTEAKSFVRRENKYWENRLKDG